MSAMGSNGARKTVAGASRSGRLLDPTANIVVSSGDIYSAYDP
jgi:hypothetical protein